MAILVIILLFLTPVFGLTDKQAAPNQLPSIQMKFLFADAIFSYNLNNLILEVEQVVNETTYLSANMLPGSFICFVLVKNDMRLEIRGSEKDKFDLKFENFGSTSLLIDHNRRKNVFNLYSLKLAERLFEEQVYELQFVLVSIDTSMPGFSSLLTIRVNSTEMSNS